MPKWTIVDNIVLNWKQSKLLPIKVNLRYMAGSLASVGRRRTTIRRRNIVSVYLVSIFQAFISWTSNNLPISLLTIVANMIWTTVVTQIKPIKAIQCCRYLYFTSSVCSLKEGCRRTLRFCWIYYQTLSGATCSDFIN